MATQLNASIGQRSSLGSVPNANVHRSKFDLSRVINTTADSGMIVPIDWFTTIPGDYFQLSAEIGLETLPAVTNILTPYRVRVGYYYLKNSDGWQGWNTFITKGRTGNVSLKVPQVNANRNYSYSGGLCSFSTPHSLSSFLGDLPRYRMNTVGQGVNIIASSPFLDASNRNYFTETGYKSVGNLSASVRPCPERRRRRFRG